MELVCLHVLQGDSGGPMACIDSSGTRVVTGTTSGGDENCDTVSLHFTPELPSSMNGSRRICRSKYISLK